MTTRDTSAAAQERRSTAHIEGCELHFATPNELTAWRAKTLFTKEPDTIEWIRGFAPGEVMIDVGANVGSYTVLAAKWRGTTVFAFEPEAQNYALLNQNIFQNGIGDKALAFCVALSDAEGYDRLYLSYQMAGTSCHSLGEEVDHNNRPRQAAAIQGCVFSSLDALVAAGVVPVPHYVKVDVDGIEPKVIAGAVKTLANPLVKSVLIEINTNLDDHWDIVDRMLELGFDYSQEQVEAAQRKTGVFAGVGNYVFFRR